MCKWYGLACPLNQHKAWWPINRWKSSYFQAVYISRAKILTKKDTKLIFFQWKLRCWFFQFWCRVDTRVNTWTSILLQNFAFLRFLTKFTRHFKVEYTSRCPPDIRIGKSNISAFTHSLEKKFNLVSFFVNFLAQSEFNGWFSRFT